MTLCGFETSTSTGGMGAQPDDDSVASGSDGDSMPASPAVSCASSFNGGCRSSGEGVGGGKRLRADDSTAAGDEAGDGVTDAEGQPPPAKVLKVNLLHPPICSACGLSIVDCQLMALKRPAVKFGSLVVEDDDDDDGGGEFCVNFLEYYHVTCLVCSHCQRQVTERDKKCWLGGGQSSSSLLCPGCAHRLSHCHGCGMRVTSDSWVHKLNSLPFHLSCFACSVCQRQLSQGEECAMLEDKLMCKMHYLETITGSSGDSFDGSGRQKSKRVRTSFTPEQLHILQTHFDLDHNPDGADLEKIAQRAQLNKRVTQVWFQNARARKKKTERTGPGDGSGCGSDGGSSCAHQQQQQQRQSAAKRLDTVQLLDESSFESKSNSPMSAQQLQQQRAAAGLMQQFFGAAATAEQLHGELVA